MSVQGKIQVYLNLSETLYHPSLAAALETVTRSFSEGAAEVQIADGTGANQAQKAWCISETLTASTRTLDLTNLTTTVGGTVTTVSFSKIKVFYGVIPAGTEGQYILLGGGGANPFYPWWSASTVKEKLMPLGSPFLKSNLGAQSSNPWTVDASNRHVLIDSGIWTIGYKLLILGV